MTKRLAPFAAGLSMLALLGWLLLSGSGPDLPPSVPGERAPATGPSPASEVPCDVPLRWRVARVDREFGIGEAEVRSAVEAAASLWEEAAGRPLFAHDPADGFPIRLVYGDRQERSRERRRRQAELSDELRRLRARRSELRGRQEAFEAARTAHEARVRDFRDRLAGHNAEVRRRNEAGGATEEVGAPLRRAEEALRRERRALEEERRELESRERSIRNEQERLNWRIRAHERRVEELDRAFPSASVEAGRYREVVREEGGRPVAVRREIRIYSFGSRRDLVRVLAHEMGHARGLGHSPVPGSLMSERYAAGELDAAPAPGPGDVELVRARCPEP